MKRFNFIHASRLYAPLPGAGKGGNSGTSDKSDKLDKSDNQATTATGSAPPPPPPPPPPVASSAPKAPPLPGKGPAAKKPTSAPKATQAEDSIDDLKKKVDGWVNGLQIKADHASQDGLTLKTARERVIAILQSIYKMDDAVILPLLQSIVLDPSKWAPTPADGLFEFYQSIQKNLTTLSKMQELHQAMNQQVANNAAVSRYAKWYKHYQDLRSNLTKVISDYKQAPTAENYQAIKKIKDAFTETYNTFDRDVMQNADSKKQGEIDRLAKDIGTVESQITALNQKIIQTQESIQNLQALVAQGGKREIELKTSLASTQSELHGQQSELTEKQTQLQNKKDSLKNNQVLQGYIEQQTLKQVFIYLFRPPTEIGLIEKVQKASAQNAAAQSASSSSSSSTTTTKRAEALDNTGLVVQGGGAVKTRQVNLQFLTLDELENIVRFFATEESEKGKKKNFYTDWLMQKSKWLQNKTVDGYQQLYEGITNLVNTYLGAPMYLSFAHLMAIADGRLEQDLQHYTSGQKLPEALFGKAKLNGKSVIHVDVKTTRENFKGGVEEFNRYVAEHETILKKDLDALNTALTEFKQTPEYQALVTRQIQFVDPEYNKERGIKSRKLEAGYFGFLSDENTAFYPQGKTQRDNLMRHFKVQSGDLHDLQNAVQNELNLSAMNYEALVDIAVGGKKPAAYAEFNQGRVDYVKRKAAEKAAADKKAREARAAQEKAEADALAQRMNEAQQIARSQFDGKFADLKRKFLHNQSKITKISFALLEQSYSFTDKEGQKPFHDFVREELRSLKNSPTDVDKVLAELIEQRMATDEAALAERQESSDPDSASSDAMSSPRSTSSTSSSESSTTDPAMTTIAVAPPPPPIPGASSATTSVLKKSIEPEAPRSESASTTTTDLTHKPAPIVRSLSSASSSASSTSTRSLHQPSAQPSPQSSTQLSAPSVRGPALQISKPSKPPADDDDFENDFLQIPTQGDDEVTLLGKRKDVRQYLRASIASIDYLAKNPEENMNELRKARAQRAIFEFFLSPSTVKLDIFSKQFIAPKDPAVNVFTQSQYTLSNSWYHVQTAELYNLQTLAVQLSIEHNTAKSYFARMQKGEDVTQLHAEFMKDDKLNRTEREIFANPKIWGLSVSICQQPEVERLLILRGFVEDLKLRVRSFEDKNYNDGFFAQTLIEILAGPRNQKTATGKSLNDPTDCIAAFKAYTAEKAVYKVRPK